MKASLFTISFLFAVNLYSFCIAAEGMKPHVRADLIADVGSIQPGSSFRVAVRLKMDEGWHTYWKNPGDSGLATKVQWNLPEELKAHLLEWPYPDRFGDPPVVSFGYSDEVLLLTRIDTDNSLESGWVTMSANVRWLECADICLPGKQKVTLVLPVEDATPEKDHEEEFAVALSRLPERPESLYFTALRTRKGIRISVKSTAGDGHTFKDMEFFPNNPDYMEANSNQKFYRWKGKYFLNLSTFPEATFPDRLKGVLTVKKIKNGKISMKAYDLDIPLNRERIP